MLLRGMLKLILISLLSPSAFADLSLIDYMNQSPQPMNAALVASEEHTAQADIDQSGGSIQLQISDGSTFQLTIPAGALPRKTKISMAELVSFEHPLLAQAKSKIGVQLSPDGLLFAKPAILKIIPKTPIAISDLVPITADHDGQEVRLATIDPTSVVTVNSVELSLNHFSPYVLTGSQTLRESILKAFNSLAASRIQAWTANEILKMKQGQTTDLAVFQKAFNEYFETVVKVHAGSVESCEGGLESQRQLLGWLRQVQLLGADDSIATDNFKTALSTKTAKLCKARVEIACYQDHRPFDVIEIALGFQRQAQLLGVENDPTGDELLHLAEKCAHFEFEMKSEIFNSEDFVMSVTAETKIKLWIENIFEGFKSQGSVQVTSMKLDLDPIKCTLTSLIAPPANSDIVDFGLRDYRFDQSLGVFIRGLYPQSAGNFKCKDDSSPPNVFDISLPMAGTQDPDSSFWGGMFLAFHSQPRANEYNAKEDKYEFFKWDVLYGEKFATKKYIRSLEMLKEETHMTIYHRPLK
jgi:hypothetical protein